MAAGCCAALMLTPAAHAAQPAADAYPNRPIRLIIPFPPGGSNDIIGRLVGMNVGERLGRTVVIDNRAGAGGNLGTELAANATPDGYTMLLISAAYAFAPAIYRKLPYDPARAFTWISKLGNGPNTLCVFPGLPVRTTKELIALAKAKPGQLNFASSGVGTSVHLATELFKMMAGIEITHIPFKGGFPAMVDVMSGNSHLIVGTLVQSLPHIRSGKLRALGYAGKKRSPTLPDVPTIDESGVPGYEVSNWWGFVMPAGTPADVIARVDRETREVLATDEIRKRFAADGAEPDYLGPEEFGRYVAAETAKWTKVVRVAGIKPQ